MSTALESHQAPGPCLAEPPDNLELWHEAADQPRVDRLVGEYIQTPAVRSQLNCETLPKGRVYYCRRGRIAFALGSPITSIADFVAVTDEFERNMAKRKMRCVYFGAENPQAQQLAIGRRRILIGSQPILTIHNWRDLKTQSAGLRAQINRGRRGMTFVPVQVLGRETKTGMRTEISACLNAWMETRPAPPMGFAADARFSTHLEYYHSVHAAVNGRGEIVAYVCLAALPVGNRFLAEHIIRKPSAPNGVIEALCDHLLSNGYIPADGQISLGLTALSERYLAMRDKNPWSFRLMRWHARRWGNRLYNFTGLEGFRRRLCDMPWKPVYMLADRRISMPELALGLAHLFFWPTASVASRQWDNRSPGGRAGIDLDGRAADNSSFLNISR